MAPALTWGLQREKYLPPVTRERSEGRESRLIIACPSMDVQDLSTGKEWNLAGRRARVGRGSHTVPCVNELKPGLELQPPGPEQHLSLLKRPLEHPGLRTSAFWPLPIPGCWDSLVSQKPWSSFSPGISCPVSKQATLLAEMSFLPNLHPEGWECGQPSGRAPASSHISCWKMHLLQRLRTPSHPPPTLPCLLPGRRCHWGPETGCPQN